MFPPEILQMSTVACINVWEGYFASNFWIEAWFLYNDTTVISSTLEYRFFCNVTVLFWRADALGVKAI